MMITILMAAYNGEKYIAEQIESILHQTERDWKLVIQDDRSTDGTFGIVEGYARKYPDRILAVQRDTPSGSAQNNFFSMLRFAGSEYTVFCDDYVWLPGKIAVTLSDMKRLEQSFGPETPLLVHTDLHVTDDELNNPLCFHDAHAETRPSRRSFNHLLIQNNVTGCTVLVNRRLLKLAARQGLPQHAVMNDWWLALIASALGQIGFIPQVIALYCPHESNLVGAKYAKAIRYNFLYRRRPPVADCGLQTGTQEFLNQFGILLDGNQRQLGWDFISIPAHSKCGRLFLLGRHGFWRSGFFWKCGQSWFT